MMFAAADGRHQARLAINISEMLAASALHGRPSAVSNADVGTIMAIGSL